MYFNLCFKFVSRDGPSRHDAEDGVQRNGDDGDEEREGDAVDGVAVPKRFEEEGRALGKCFLKNHPQRQREKEGKKNKRRADERHTDERMIAGGAARVSF